jgi:hypothetical protein
MSFKHTNFEDSVTMRSLEKLARDKGLVKDQPMTKVAAASELDLSPSESLTENVLKLCSGLRHAGFDKYATELEGKLLAYKQVQTLYEVNKETGDDLVHAAHPKGSHKLEDVDSSEAVFEDILDQHLKHVTMVEKDPTGKLSSASEVLSAVKNVFAQSASLAEVNRLANGIVNQVNAIAKASNPELTFSINNWVNSISSLAGDPTVYNINEIKKQLKILYERLDPSILSGGTYGLGGLSDYTWSRVQGAFRQANTLADQAIAKRRDVDAGTPVENDTGTEQDKPSVTQQMKEYTPEASPLSSLYKRIGTLRQKLQSAGLIGSVARNSSAMAWIKEESASLTDLANRMGKVPETQEAQMATILEKELATYEQEVEQFYNQWVQTKA